MDVRSAVYPKYETRGDLAACVETFREWYDGTLVLLIQIDSFDLELNSL